MAFLTRGSIRNEPRLNHIWEILPDMAIYKLNVSGEVSGWSEAAQRLLGFTSGEVIGHHLEELAKKALTIAPVSALEEALRDGQSETFGLAIRKDGSRFWANEVTVPIRDGEGKATGFGKVVRDVTSWKVSQEERDRIFMLSADLIGVCGFDGFFKRINPSFSRVLGYSEAEILGKPYLEFVHPDDVEATRREAGAIAQGNGDAVTLSFVNRYLCADGTICSLEWKVQTVMSEQLMYCVARDVTKQKATERKLETYTRELERSNEELRQFAYVASHDLQEPLRAVVGCVEMLGQRNSGKLDERSVELIGHVADGARRMQTLIRDLLAYSRIGSKGIAKAWVDASVIVEKALRQLRVAVNESGAVITVDALPQLMADPVQLGQLFQNLIGNAIKFRTQQPPQIHVGAEMTDREIVFSISDHGIGIAPEYHERMFGMFQRLNSRKRYPGTGVGLAICKKVVERHGGRIWVESRFGEGSVFRFAVPTGTTS
jgi:PAS domain S-box-containing protein